MQLGLPRSHAQKNMKKTEVPQNEPAFLNAFFVYICSLGSRIFYDFILMYLVYIYI